MPGIGNWISTQLYNPTTVIIGPDGNVYRAVIQNIGQNPVGNPTYWTDTTTLTSVPTATIEADDIPLAFLDGRYQSSGAYVALTTVAEAGDLIVGTSAGQVTNLPPSDDGLALTTSSTSRGGLAWSGSGQMYIGSGAPTDVIFGSTYVAQPGVVALYYDYSAGEPYIRELSPTTGQPVWVNLVPLILYGGS